MTPSDERSRTVMLASRILDRINADPDDDLAMLSRQFLGEVERGNRLAERCKIVEADNAALVKWKHTEGGAYVWGDYMVAERIDDKGWNASFTTNDEEIHEDIAMAVTLQIGKAACEAHARQSGIHTLTLRLAGMEEALKSCLVELQKVVDSGRRVGIDLPVHIDFASAMKKAQQALEGKP